LNDYKFDKFKLINHKFFNNYITYLVIFNILLSYSDYSDDSCFAGFLATFWAGDTAFRGGDTALVTAFPPYRDLSPSLSSTASCEPVDAPEGTAARPKDPSDKVTSASTVGFPRESKICLA
jgi:hypothetical protein